MNIFGNCPPLRARFVAMSGVDISRRSARRSRSRWGPGERDPDGQVADAGQATRARPTANPRRHGDVRDDGTDSRADDAHPQPEDEDGVDDDIDDSPAAAEDHRRPGVVGTDERPTAHEVERRERDADADDPEIVRPEGGRRFTGADQVDEDARNQGVQQRDGERDSHGEHHTHLHGLGEFLVRTGAEALGDEADGPARDAAAEREREPQNGAA